MAIQFSTPVNGSDFIGRNELLNTILRNIVAGQGTSVIGFPGVGLTSVFEALRNALEYKPISKSDSFHVYVYITLQQTSDSNALVRAFCEGLRDGLKDGLANWSADNELNRIKMTSFVNELGHKVQNVSTDYGSILSVALDKCKRLGIDVVYIIDRFHHVGNNLTPSFYSSLKTYKCTYVIFSNKAITQIEDEVAANYSEKPSTFNNKLDERYCGAFTSEEYSDYMRYLEKETDRNVSRNVRELFTSFAGKFPSLLNRIVFALNSEVDRRDIDRRWLQKQVNIENEYRIIFDYILNIRLSSDEVSAGIKDRDGIEKKRVEDITSLVKGGGDNGLAPLRDRLMKVGIFQLTSGGHCEFFSSEFRSYFFSRRSETLDFISKWNRVENECRALCFTALEQDILECKYTNNITDYLLDDKGYFAADYFRNESEKVCGFQERLKREFRDSEVNETYIFPTNPSDLWNLFIDFLWNSFFENIFQGEIDWAKRFREMVDLRNIIDHNNLSDIENAKTSGAYARGVSICDAILLAIDNSNLKGVIPCFPRPTVGADDHYHGKMLRSKYGKGYVINHRGKWLYVDKEEAICVKTSCDEVGSDGLRVKYSIKTIGDRMYAVNVEEL